MVLSTRTTKCARTASARRGAALRPLPALLVLLLAAEAAAGAGDRPSFGAYGPEAAFDPAPSVIPDRIVLTIAGDPATTEAVTWRTSAEVEAALAEIAIATASPDFYESAVRYEAKNEPLESDIGPAVYHSVVFENLLPGTLYAYRVGSDKGWSEWFQFRTAEGGPGPFSFLCFGDVQNNILSLWSRVVREAHATAPRARFQIYTGDLVSDGDKDEQWGSFFRAGAWIFATVPSVPAIGNHEYAGDDTPPAHWRRQFTLPENGVPGLEETNYFIDYESLRIIVLNAIVEPGRETSWLEGVLRETSAKWIVAAFHYPVHSAAGDRDNKELREEWKPLLERYGVDLVLQGHDHTYARGRNLPAAGEIRPGSEGPMYVVSVSGPKMYELPESGWWDRAAENTELFQVITIDADTLLYEAYTATGEPFDSFEIVKPKR